MIRVISIYLAALVFSATNAFAQITVRSGEHGEFTRLVFSSPKNVEWSMSQTGNTVEFRFPQNTNGFDLTQAFGRIDRSRIKSISTTEGFVTVSLACDCQAEASSANERLIVLDISPRAASNQNETSRVARAESNEERSLGFGATVSSVDQQTMPMLSVAISDLMENEVKSPETGFRPKEQMARIQEDLDRDTGNLQSAQTQLTERIGAAATRGVLTPSGQIPLSPAPSTRPQIDLEIFDSSQFLPQVSTSENRVSGNIRITSSLDTDNAPFGSVGPQGGAGSGCLDPQAVAISSWATQQPLADQLASARSELFGEFDEINLQAAVKLARIYLHFGFGPEAMRVLDLDPRLIAENGVLIEMGEIFEYGYVRQPKILKEYLDCESPIALWAALSVRSLGSDSFVDVQAALLELNSFPVHLRDILAPEFSRRMLQYGDKSAASAALRSVERLSIPASDRAKIVKADIHLKEGDVKTAQSKLSEIVSSNSEQSAEALIKFVETKLAAGEDITPETALLVEAYAQELRDDALGPALRRTHVLALGKSMQFDAAFAALDALSSSKATDATSDLTNELTSMLALNAMDVTFLDLVFSRQNSDRKMYHPMTIYRVASRLLELGFAAAADETLAESSTLSNGESTKVLRAKVALALGKPALAESLVLDVMSPQADLLRAQAKRDLDQFDGASRLYAQVDDTPSAQETAFLSDAWQETTSNDLPVFSDLAQLAGTDLVVQSQRDGMLARTKELLEGARYARKSVEAVLNGNLEFQSTKD